MLDGERYEGALSFGEAFTPLSQLPPSGLFGAVRRSPFQTYRVVTSLTAELIADCLRFFSVNQGVISNFNCSDVRYPLEVNADRATPGR